MSAHPAPDFAHLRLYLDRLGRARDRTGLAELLLEGLEEALSPDRALVVFRHPRHGRPTVFGESFEERRVVGRALRRGTPRGEDESAVVGRVLGPSMRAVRIGEGTPGKGMIYVSRETRALRGDEVEYMRFLSVAAADNLDRLGLRLRVEELAEEVHDAAVSLEREEQLRLMGRVAVGVAADVNQALAPVLAYSTLLLATEQNLETRRYLEGILLSARDVVEVVRTLRELHPDGGALPRLPLGPRSVSGEADEFAAEPAFEPPIESAAEPARILCIDEDAAVLTLLRTIFERDGHRVSTVVGGESGIEAFVEGLQSGRPWDLVITDLCLSDVHGFGVVRALRASDPRVPILILTASTQHLPTDLAGMEGIRAHAKPLEVMQMRREIRDILTPADTGQAAAS